VEIYAAMGAVALVLLVALSAAVRSQTRRCPHCTKWIDRGATRCPHCTSDVGPEKAVGSEPRMKECRFCYRPIDYRASRCHHCGVDLGATAPPPVPPA
jgi:hypothetical protein